MLINGKIVKELRESTGIERGALAEALAIDPLQLSKYEEGEFWFEEDLFRLLILSEIMPEYDYLIDGEFSELLEDIFSHYEIED